MCEFSFFILPLVKELTKEGKKIDGTTTNHDQIKNGNSLPKRLHVQPGRLDDARQVLVPGRTLQ
ncbi:hypothetical protein BMG_1579 [Priestia megaterium]|nr:hypothetical protein BMG_1579 [Priestia megaterium]